MANIFFLSGFNIAHNLNKMKFKIKAKGQLAQKH